MEGLLESRMCELIDLYTEMEDCHVYLVDEYSGLPVASGAYSLRMNFSSDIAKTLIPPTLLAMRSNFPLGMVPLLGLTLEDLPDKWSKISDLDISYAQSNPADEIQILQSKLGVKSDVGILSLLERFFMKNDPEEDFSGLRRLCSPNGLMIWVTKKSRQEALQHAKQGLTQLKHSKAMEAREKFGTATKNKSSNNSGSLWCDVNTSHSRPKASHKDLPSPPPGRGSPVSQQRRWRNSKDFDADQSNVQRNDIQQKLDRLKSWKSAQSNKSAGSDLSNPIGLTEKETDMNMVKSMSSDDEDSISEHEVQHKIVPVKMHQIDDEARNISSVQNSDPHTLNNHRANAFESTVDPEPNTETMESHRNNSDGQLSTESSSNTSVDENNDNNVPDDTDITTSKHRSEGNPVGEGNGSIQIESLHSVKSDISDVYGAKWSPVDSDDEDEGSEWCEMRPEERDPKPETSPDRGKVFQEPTTVVPRMLRHGGKANVKRQVFRDPSDDTVSMASSKVNTNRLRPNPKTGSISGQRRGPVPGGGSVTGDRSTRVLGVNSKASQQRMHPKKRMAFKGFEDDNDSYFRAPRSRFDRIRPDA